MENFGFAKRLATSIVARTQEKGKINTKSLRFPLEKGLTCIQKENIIISNVSHTM